MGSTWRPPTCPIAGSTPRSYKYPVLSHSASTHLSNSRRSEHTHSLPVSSSSSSLEAVRLDECLALCLWCVIMTNQDVVVSEMGIAAGAALPGGPAGPAGGLFACRSAAASMRQTYLDLAAAAVAARSASCTSWADAMRASSPTRSSRSASDVDEFTAWVRKHPSALSKFEEIAAKSRGKKIVMFMDYDGTLSPIVADPDTAYMSDAMRAAVREVAKTFPTAIVSGRCRDKVRNFVGLSDLYYAGSHGMDIKGPSSNPESALCQPASEFLPMIDEVYKTLVEKTKSTPGAKVENNKFCLSVHFRCVDEKEKPTPNIGVLVNGRGNQVRTSHWLPSRPTRPAFDEPAHVLEIRPSIKWDKGKALEFLLESLGIVVTVAFVSVLRKRGQGLGILVSKCPKDTNASYSLQDPTEVMEFLLRLVEWKRKSSSSSLMIRPRV
uniref:Trehalose 6-phosphate phosphatase n=1 Tax=Oryza rufipogon TaxID=4529 RepID=A0A0E0NL31_ORYRU